MTTALVSGLFYIAPGTGFLLGSVIGGRLSDRTVKKYIKRRNGLRLPQDRLNSGLSMILGVLPVSTLIYAWTLQKEVGGMVVPIISAFFAGFGLMGVYNSLNTYTAGVCAAIFYFFFSFLIEKYESLLCIPRGSPSRKSRSHQQQIPSAVHVWSRHYWSHCAFDQRRWCRMDIHYMCVFLALFQRGFFPIANFFDTAVIMCMIGGGLTFLISRKGVEMQNWIVKKIQKK